MAGINLTENDDTYTATNAGDVISGLGGNDTITASDGGNDLRGNLGDDTLNGGIGNDILWGDDSTSFMGHNLLNGKGGNDVINSYSWYDQIAGGSGDDIVISFAMTTGQIVDGGTGTDTIQIRSLSEQSDSVHIVFGSTFSPTVGTVQGATYTNFEKLYFVGGTGPNTIEGGAQADTLINTFTNVSSFAAGSLKGFGGDDSLQFSGLPVSGIETLDGGDGNDTLVWTNGFATFSDLIIDAATGNMKEAGTVFAHFTGIEALSIQTFSGATGTIRLNGSEGNDGVNIAASSSTVDGNGGNDSITIVSGSATVDGGAGNDGIFVAFADTQSTVLHGGAGDDSVTGGQGESQLYGDDGHDTISGYNGRSDAYGGSGDDTIYNTSSYSMAGTGTGTIDGGSGYDIATIERSAGGATYNIDFTAASITLADGTQILRCEAISFVASSANDTMTASNGSGGYLHNKLNGLGGDDVLIASSNGATLDGSTGTNRLIASRSVDSLAWGIAEYSASDKGVTVDLNITTAQGGKGYAKGDLIQATVLSVTGSDFADKLTGDTFTNTLNGGAGNDRLTGGTGFHDMLTGGAGKDNFVYGGAADSTGANYDSVGDFDAKQDTFQVVSAVSKIDNTIGSGALNQASFDADLGAAIGSALKAGHAILFTPDSGTLAGKTFLVVDQDGTVGYQSGGDLVLDITGATHLSNLAAGNFVV